MPQMGGSQPGAVLPPCRGYLAMSGDMAGCHSWRGSECYWHAVGRDQAGATQNSPCNRRIIWSKMSTVLELRNPVVPKAINHSLLVAGQKVSCRSEWEEQNKERVV